MVVTIVILGAAVVAAVAYFAAWIVAVGEARKGGSGWSFRARRGSAPGAAPFGHALPSKEES
jgi:hypothetical protein